MLTESAGTLAAAYLANVMCVTLFNLILDVEVTVIDVSIYRGHIHISFTIACQLLSYVGVVQ